MTIFIQNKTRCSICDERIAEGEERLAFPILFAGETHPLKKFNDSSLHVRCLKNSTEGLLLETAYLRYKQISANRQKNICSLCDEEIKNPDENYAFGFLPEPMASSFADQNCGCAHPKCLSSWSRLEEYIEALNAVAQKYRWSNYERKMNLEPLVKLLDS